MKLPIELIKITKSAKVSPAAWDRISEIAKRRGASIGDVVSICLFYMPETDIADKLNEQKAELSKLPDSVRGLLANIHKLDSDVKAVLSEMLKGE